MKILHVIDSLTMGGAEKLVLDTLPIYNSMEGVTADVALLDANEYIFLKKLKKQNCCKIYGLSLGNLYNPMLIFKLIPIIREYDIIHVHLFPAQYFAVIANLFSWKKMVFTEHNSFNRRMKNPLFKLLEKMIYKLYKKIICISPEVKEVMRNELMINENKLITIENGINISDVQKASTADRNEFGYTEEDIVIIMVAKFRQQKDHETLLKSLTKLPPKYKLLLVGDGEKERYDEIVNLVEGLKIKDRVIFTGARGDVFSLYKMSNIAVLSSNWEGFGLVAAEAMASGTPLIASNVPGLSEVVFGGGILFEKGNVDDLTKKIFDLADNNIYRSTSQKGQRKAQKYDINTLVEQTIRLYKSL